MSPNIDRSRIGPSSSRMDKVAPVGRRFPRSSYKSHDGASPRPKSGVLRPLVLKTSCNEYSVWIVFICAATSSYFSMTSAQDSPVPFLQAVANFSMSGTSYDCISNMFCLGDAHVYKSDAGVSGIELGRLSLLLPNEPSQGVAYFQQPVKFLYRSNQAASFSTNFTIDVRLGLDLNGSRTRGDGMTFVMSAQANYTSYDGDVGGNFGIFDELSGFSTPFKSVAVEFDTYMNTIHPVNDINDNHVSFDFMNITAIAPAEASKVSVNLTDETTKYAWVDYSSETQILEVRVSYNNTRPINALSNCTVNLVDFVEENMWVGFSSSSGSTYSNFFIGDWTFQSYEIPALGPVSAPAPPPSSPLPTAPSPATTAGAKSGGHKLGIIIGISVGSLTFLLACVVVIALFVQRRSPGLVSTEGDLIHLEGMPERFTYNHLSVATKSFNEELKLGQGGFGSVYRGVLPSSGIPVAIKKINSESKQGEKEFMAEVSIIGQLRHKNLIQLQGWCKDASKGQYLLVYELMPNGSLDKVLFGLKSQAACLSWEQRFNIVTGTAAAVDYLHQGWIQQVIHRDIKASNIMLDKEWNAKLGDFGLARLVDHRKVAVTTKVAGTHGYIAPEAVFSGRFTDKADVFAFGAVVLEIACGRSAFSDDVPPEEFSLVEWVWQSLSEGALLSRVDKRLVEYDKDQMEVMLIVGLLCSHPNPLARPSMRHVVQFLAGDTPLPSIPASMPALFDSDSERRLIDCLHFQI